MTVAEQLKQAGAWSIFSTPSTHPPAAVAPGPLAKAGAEILEQRVGLPVPGPFADQQQYFAQPAPSKVPLYLGLALGGAALIGLVLHFTRGRS